MNSLKVNIKKLHKDAVIPKYAKNGDAGLDLTAVSVERINASTVCYDFGLSLEIPKGYFGMIVPRSSNYKKDQLLSNSCGIVDSEYRGSLKAMFKDINSGFDKHQIGERIAQLIILPYPQIEFKEVEEVSETSRGQSGFGSSGR